MTASDENRAGYAADQAVLHSLALKAIGLSGADIERLIREARQRARRERRGLSFSDIHAGLSSTKPTPSEALRRCMAIHEAGHAITHLHYGTTRITAITIDGPTGGYIEGVTDDFDTQTEDATSANLVTRLGGRAAEAEILGSVSAGAGGSPDSDLAQATDLALAMEVSLGFSAETPLLYRDTGDRLSLLNYHPLLAGRVNARLEAAYEQARNLIRRNRDAVQFLAEALLRQGTLEGAELDLILRRVRAQLGAVQ